jgi:hypothetical protein
VILEESGVEKSGSKESVSESESDSESEKWDSIQNIIQ